MLNRIVCYTLGKTVLIEAALLLLPAIVASLYDEPLMPFLMASLLAAMTGASMVLLSRGDIQHRCTKDGFLIVSLSWIMLSLFGALPFFLSGSIPSYFDAFFEAVSGFTTTGASILPDVESLGRGILFWRSFTHWIGGMGVLVFVLAIAEKNPNRSINILKAEMPGTRVDKFKPKAKSTATVLYVIYIVMTFAEIVLLAAGGMPLYDSVVHAVGTAGTGGFGIYNDSLGSASAYSQIVIATFMMLFAVNFSAYYMIMHKRWNNLLKFPELKWFFSIVVAATIGVMVVNRGIYPALGENFRTAYFQVTTIISTTGYSSADFDLWPATSKAILFLLMFIGGCEGSTAGGFKVSRVMILSHSIRNEMKRSLHPRLVRNVRIGGKTIEPEAVSGIATYLAVYIMTGCIAFLLIAHEPMGFETNLTAVVACLNNIGPGFAGVGPSANFAEYSNFAKCVLSIVMLLGRLEIYPILLSFSRDKSRY